MVDDEDAVLLVGVLDVPAAIVVIEYNTGNVETKYKITAYKKNPPIRQC